jgi:hypothetical protein
MVWLLAKAEIENKLIKAIRIAGLLIESFGMRPPYSVSTTIEVVTENDCLRSTQLLAIMIDTSSDPNLVISWFGVHGYVVLIE